MHIRLNTAEKDLMSVTLEKEEFVSENFDTMYIVEITAATAPS